MNVPKRRKLNKAIKDLLEDKIGRPVGIATAPRNIQNGQAELPYIVIHPISGVGYNGPQFCSPQGDARFDYQIDSYGKRDDQAEWLADSVRDILVDPDNIPFINQITFPDLKIMDQDIIGPTGKLDNVGQIWTVKETFGFSVTTSS